MSLITPEFGLLFWMTIIFAVVFFILAKFGFPIITSMVEKRSDMITDSLVQAEQARKAIEGLQQTARQIREQAQAEQARILREASATRDAILAKAREEAAQEAEKILCGAQAQIEEQKQAAMRELRREVAKVSVAVAEKVVQQQLENNKVTVK